MIEGPEGAANILKLNPSTILSRMKRHRALVNVRLGLSDTSGLPDRRGAMPQRTACSSPRPPESRRRPGVAQESAARSRSPVPDQGLRREFALRDLTLPGVPKAYDLFRSDGICWLVLEDTGGAPLASMLATGPIKVASFFHLALQLSSILAGLHRLDVIHKNVQPGSIFVHLATRELWLGGFDLASRGSGETQEPVAPTLLAGTLAYLSPEQTGRMNRAIDHRTDFYSLGMTFYELLTGLRPFRSTGPTSSS